MPREGDDETTAGPNRRHAHSGTAVVRKLDSKIRSEKIPSRLVRQTEVSYYCKNKNVFLDAQDYLISVRIRHSMEELRNYYALPDRNALAQFEPPP